MWIACLRRDRGRRRGTMRNGSIRSRVILSFMEKRPSSEKSARNRVSLRSQIPNPGLFPVSSREVPCFPRRWHRTAGTVRFRTRRFRGCRLAIPRPRPSNASLKGDGADDRASRCGRSGGRKTVCSRFGKARLAPHCSPSRSGRFARVRSSAFSCFHSAILPWCPDIRTSGTFMPRNSTGLV